MSAAADTDLKLIEHLDFAIVCKSDVVHFIKILNLLLPTEKVKPCGEPAAAIAHCRMCPASSPVCADHQAQLTVLVPITCGRCNNTAPGALLFLFSPLGAS